MNFLAQRVAWLTACTTALTGVGAAWESESAGPGHADPVAAIAGKQLCACGVLGKGIDRVSVGLGMVPRGEVGLIFANIGLALAVQGERIITPATFSAVVVMVIVATMATPPALKWSLGRSARQAAAGQRPHGDARRDAEDPRASDDIGNRSS